MSVHENSPFFFMAPALPKLFDTKLWVNLMEKGREALELPFYLRIKKGVEEKQKYTTLIFLSETVDSPQANQHATEG